MPAKQSEKNIPYIRLQFGEKLYIRTFLNGHTREMKAGLIARVFACAGEWGGSEQWQERETKSKATTIWTLDIEET